MPFYRLAAAVLCAAALSLPAQAAPLSAAQTLNQFNLVVFGDAVSTSHVDGRTYVGGNLRGGDYVLHAQDMPASDHAGLVVRGNASNLNVNGGGVAVGGNLSSANINRGAASVGGNASGVNFNGGAAYVGGSSSGSNFNGGRLNEAPAQPSVDAIESTLRDLSLQLSGLAGTGSSVDVRGNRVTFNAVAGDDGIAVFDLTALDTELFRKGEFEFNLNGAELLIFNLDDLVFDFGINFLGGSAQGIGSKAIWNFYNATDLTIYNQFGGSVLAPNAHLSNYNNIEGTVVAGSLSQYGEIHLQPITHPLLPPPLVPPPPLSAVPEPGTLALLFAALGALALGRRQKALGVVRVG